MPLSTITWPTIDKMLAEVTNRGVELLSQAGVPAAEIRVEIAVDMRLSGQAHEITVPLGETAPTRGDEGRLREAFHSTYETLFGRQPPNVAAEVVSWRVRVAGPRPAFPIHAGGSGLEGTFGDVVKEKRSAYFPETQGYVETPVLDRYRLGPGSSFAGPAIVEERESTLVVGPGAFAYVDEFLNVLVEVPGS